MAEIIKMPRLSDTMEEGTVATWFKKVGDTVNEGDILAEIETDKATMEFEAFYEGELLYVGIHEGETAAVDSLLAIIGEKGEDISQHLSAGAPVIETNQATEAAPAVDTQATAAVTMPDNVEVITMPRLSDTMEEGTVASWLKKVGDTVNEGDILAEIETDKATMEFEAFYAGTLLHIGIQEGESAPVDSLLAIIGDKDVDVAQAIAAATAATSSVSDESTESPKEPAVAAPVATPVAAPVAAPTVKSTPAPTPVKNTTDRIIASPLAKKLADERGIQITNVPGSGEGGRIVKRDIENYQVTGSAAAMPQGIESSEEVPNNQMRKTIAKRLAASKFNAPHYYLSVEFDMENAMAFRQQYNAIPDTKISFNDIVVKATAKALKQHPQVNSRWHDDKIVKNHHVHMGVAVAVEDGLVVPVVKFADELSLPQIGAQVKDYAGRARDKKLTPAEMDGSTFTISNLGMFGIETFTSIINQPNSAILSVGAIVEKPVVKNGAIVVGHTMKLTLACDHRSVDGATGSLFLQTLKGYIENPVTMLV